MFPEINYDLCTSCKVCIDICPYEVFGDIDNKASVVNPENCIECGECIRNCDSKAIILV